MTAGILKELPPVWGGLTGKGVTPVINEAQTAHMPNKPFAIDNPKGFNTASLNVTTHDLWHLLLRRTRCRSTAARTTCSPPGPIPAAW